MDRSGYNQDETGGYKPTDPVTTGNYSYAEVEVMVLRAIGPVGAEEGARTLAQIKKHAGLQKGDDISSVIEGMVGERKIRKESNGSITAYFRYRDKPARFWLTGNDTVKAEFAEGPAQLPPQTPDKPSSPDNDPADENERLQVPEPRHQSDEGPPKRKMPTKPEISPEAFEQLAAEGLSQAEAAERLGLTVFVFKNRLNTKTKDGDRSEYRKAWDRGLKARSKTHEPKPAKPKRGPRNTRPVEEPKQVENKRKNEIPPESPIKITGIERVEEQKPGQPKDLPSDIRPRVQSRYVTFEDGSQLLVAFEGNLFRLKTEELELLGRVAEIVETYPPGRKTSSLWERIRQSIRGV